MIPRPGRRPYHQIVNPMATRLAGLPRSLGAWVAALPPRRQELLADAGLGVALAAVNVVALLPYRAQQHPLWLAPLLAAPPGPPPAPAPAPPPQSRRAPSPPRAA